VKLQVYRPIKKDFWNVEDDAKTFSLVGENEVFADGSGMQEFDIEDNEQIIMKRGDVVGWRIEGVAEDRLGVIDFDFSRGINNILLTMTMPPPAINDRVPFPFVGDRKYSISCTYKTLFTHPLFVEVHWLLTIFYHDDLLFFLCYLLEWV